MSEEDAQDRKAADAERRTVRRRLQRVANQVPDFRRLARFVPAGLVRVLNALWLGAARMSNEDGFEISGYIAFMSFFAFFPFLIFLAALAGFLGEPESVPVLVDMMFSFLPPEVAGVLSPAVSEVINLRTAGLLTFGILATMWTASSGIESLRTALNRAYGIQSPRPIWFRRLQSIAFVLLGSFALLLLSLSVILGPVIWQVAAPALNLLAREQVIWTLARYGVAVAVLAGSLTALHLWLPNRPRSVRAVLPGVTVTAVAWITLGSAFSIYLSYFNSYPATYGSLGGIVITLFFLYLSALLFIFGAYFNASLQALNASDDSSGAT